MDAFVLVRTLGGVLIAMVAAGMKNPIGVAPLIIMAVVFLAAYVISILKCTKGCTKTESNNGASEKLLLAPADDKTDLSKNPAPADQAKPPEALKVEPPKVEPVAVDPPKSDSSVVTNPPLKIEPSGVEVAKPISADESAPEKLD